MASLNKGLRCQGDLRRSPSEAHDGSLATPPRGIGGDATIAEYCVPAMVRLGGEWMSRCSGACIEPASRYGQYMSGRVRTGAGGGDCLA